MVQSIIAFPETLEINHNYFEIRIVDHKIEYLRLGNWSDAGWCWEASNDLESELFLFLCRGLTNNDFIEEISKHPGTYEMFADTCATALEDGKGSLYGITGDNSRWKHGNDDEVFLEELKYDKTEEGMSEELFDEYVEEYEYPSMNYEDFIMQYGHQISEKCIEVIRNATGWEDLSNELREFKIYGVNEYYSEYANNLTIGAFEDAVKAVKDKKEKVTVKRNDPMVQGMKN